MHHNVPDRSSPPLIANNNYLVLFYISHVIVLFFFLLIFFSFICIYNGSQLRDGSRVRNSTLEIFSSKTIILFSFTLFSPDTYFGTDFMLSVNATGLLCNSILPVVTLCVVALYSIFYL